MSDLIVSSNAISRTTEVIPELLTCYIPGRGNDLQLLERICTFRDKHVVFVGSSNSGKSSLMESCIREFSELKGSTPAIFTPNSLLAFIESFRCAQQGSRLNSDRSIVSVSCLFNETGNFLGAGVSLLGLELTKVSNYLVFHDLITFASQSLRTTLHLGKLTNIDWDGGSADKQRFADFQEFLKSISDVNEDFKMSFFKILAGIMHLQCVQIYETEDDEQAQISDLTITSELLGLESKSLLRTLGVRKIAGGRRTSVAETRNTLEQTKRCRDALVKQLYRSLMNWCLKKVNNLAERLEASAVSCLHLIDIPGAESLQVNSLEQLCRNYSNEMIHNLMRNTFFEKESSLCKTQGLGERWVDQDIPKTSEALNLFMLPVKGLLPLLDVQTQLGEAASDKAYLSQTRMHWGGVNATACFTKPRFGEDDGFVVKHFFGSIQYNIAGFVDKNSENVHKTFANLNLMLQKSTNPILSDIYANNFLADTSTDKRQEHVGRSFQGVRVLRLMAAVMDQYRCDMMMGNRILSETKILCSALEEADHVHFVVCSAPHEKFPKIRSVNESWIKQQQDFYFVEKAVAARHYDYPYRAKLSAVGKLSRDTDLLVRMQSCAPHLLGFASFGLILDHILVADEFHRGPDYVLLKAGTLEKISAYATSFKTRVAIRIQSAARRFVCRKKYLQLLVDAEEVRVAVAKAAKIAYKELQLLNKKIALVVWLQSRHRGHVARDMFREKRRVELRAIVKIQSVYRKHVARIEFNAVLEKKLDVEKLIGAAQLVLMPNEKVELMGYVMKESNWSIVGKRKRVLILTAAAQPRLLYVDQDKHEVRGIILLSERISASATNTDQKFEVHTQSRTYKFNVTTGAWKWRDAILRACACASPRDNNENVRINRSFSIISTPNGTPTKSGNKNHGRMHSIAEGVSLSASFSTSPAMSKYSDAGSPLVSKSSSSRPASALTPGSPAVVSTNTRTALTPASRANNFMRNIR